MERGTYNFFHNPPRWPPGAGKDSLTDSAATEFGIRAQELRFAVIGSYPREISVCSLAQWGETQDSEASLWVDL